VFESPAADPIERFRTFESRGAMGRAVRIGFVFGPRALRRAGARPMRVLFADESGAQHLATTSFPDAASIARFWVAQLNASLRRARLAARVRVGAVARLENEEARVFGPDPGTRLVDLFEGRVRTRGRTLPLECWATGAGVSCILLLLDWAMSRTRIERGGWAGLAPGPALRQQGVVRFHPVAVADLHCALTAHSAAHEFGHVLGCTHEDAPNPLAPRARGFAARGSPTFTVMAAARRNERGRRLEWSRPSPRGDKWEFGDAEHDEAAWLSVALPLLARQRFRCSGACSGACVDLAS
jgi:hypothetical protein